MAFADYYDRAALAASQVLGGFDSDAFRNKLGQSPVGVAIGSDAVASNEGRVLLDMTVRLLARLYPALAIVPSAGAEEEAARLSELANSINPQIEIDLGQRNTRIGVVVGSDIHVAFDRTVFAGSDGWDAYVSSTTPVAVGTTANPLGAGAAACLAAGEVFKALLLSPEQREDVSFSTFLRAKGVTDPQVPNTGWSLAADAVLVGLGAVGNGAAWALSRSPLEGRVHLVDDETVELSNLQRYVMASRADEGAVKVELAGSAFKGRLEAVTWKRTWAQFLSEAGYAWEHVLSALDTAGDRRSIQAALPRWVTNAWTQPGDLGVALHSNFGGDGACLYCLYLPDRVAPNEDEVIAYALGVPQLVTEIRTLLHNGEGVQRPFLHAVAVALELPLDAVLPFVGRRIRELYVEGVCGGALLPLGSAGAPRPEVHVPLAHQSALAGVLLAAGLARRCVAGILPVTEVTRLDVLGPIPEFATQPALVAGTGHCVCEDDDYVTAYRRKYSSDSGPPAAPRPLPAGTRR